MGIWDVFKKIDQERKNQKKRAKRHNSPQTESNTPLQDTRAVIQHQPTENDMSQQLQPQEPQDPRIRLHDLKLELDELKEQKKEAKKWVADEEEELSRMRIELRMEHPKVSADDCSFQTQCYINASKELDEIKARIKEIKREIFQLELESQQSTEDAERQRQALQTELKKKHQQDLETREQKYEDKTSQLEAQIQQLQEQLHALKAEQEHANKQQTEAEAELDRNRSNELYQEQHARVRREIALEVRATADPDATDEEMQAEAERCLRLWETQNPPPN